MKRYVIAPRIGTGTSVDPYRPDLTGSWVVVAERGNWLLCKRIVATGTAADAATIADLDADETDAVAAALTLAQRNAIRTFLANRGVEVADFDGADRRRLLRWLVHKFGLEPQEALGGYNVSEG